MKTFIKWTEWIDTSGPTDPRPSEVHRIALLIARAGSAGVSRRELGHKFDLPGRLVDGVLAAMLTTGQLTASDDGDQRTYRAVPWVQAVTAHAAEEEKKLRRSR